MRRPLCAFFARALSLTTQPRHGPHHSSFSRRASEPVDSDRAAAPISGYTPSDYITYSDDPGHACAHDAEVVVDAPARTVTLSKIFKWYYVDFGADKAARLRFLLSHLGAEMAAALKVRRRSFAWRSALVACVCARTRLLPSHRSCTTPCVRPQKRRCWTPTHLRAAFA